MADMNENVIEWLDGEDVIAVTLHQKRFVNKVKKFAEKDKNVVIWQRILTAVYLLTYPFPI